MITEGKWEAELTAMGFCVLGGRHYSAIAERYFDRNPNKAELAELHANAALIAASPMLLEALNGLISVISSDINDYPDHQLYRMVGDKVVKAEKAIAAAGVTK